MGYAPAALFTTQTNATGPSPPRPILRVPLAVGGVEES